VQPTTWLDALERWTAHQVRPPAVVTFDRGRHEHDEPWVLATTERAAWTSLNPQRLTALHLARGQVTGSPSLFAAYAISCVALEHCSAYSGALFELSQLARDHLLGAGLNFQQMWERNSRFVLPSFPSAQSFKWEEDVEVGVCIDSAASYWTALGTELSIVRVPDLMDPRSQEWAEWQAYLAQQHLQRERMEYERLKEKFKEQP